MLAPLPAAFGTELMPGTAPNWTAVTVLPAPQLLFAKDTYTVRPAASAGAAANPPTSAAVMAAVASHRLGFRSVVSVICVPFK